VPALKEFLDAPYTDPRHFLWAAFALARITGDTATYVPLVHECLDDPGEPHERASVRGPTLEALRLLGPPVKAALPRLKELAQSGDDATARAAKQAVTAIEGGQGMN
jgi:hypothetical protein